MDIITGSPGDDIIIAKCPHGMIDRRVMLRALSTIPATFRIGENFEDSRILPEHAPIETHNYTLIAILPMFDSALAFFARDDKFALLNNGLVEVKPDEGCYMFDDSCNHIHRSFDYYYSRGEYTRIAQE